MCSHRSRKRGKVYKAALELEPGEIAKYTVVRVGDEICVDLMASASGFDYEEAFGKGA